MVWQPGKVAARTERIRRVWLALRHRSKTRTSHMSRSGPRTAAAARPAEGSETGASGQAAPKAKCQAARDLTAAGALAVKVGDRYELTDIAKAHDRVDAGGRGRVLVTSP